MNSIISDYEIISPFGIGPEIHVQKILSGMSAISKVDPNFGGKNFDVSYYGALDFKSLGYREHLHISKHHFVAQLLLDRIVPRMIDKSIDAVILLGKHFLISDLSATPLEPSVTLKDHYFLARYIESYLKNAYGIHIPKEQIYEINNTCTSGTSLISLASQGIRHNQWRQVIVLAIDLADPFTLTSLQTLGALSRHDIPEQASKPFDKQRSGFVKSDGAAVALIKSETVALSPHERTPLKILGFCQTSDGHHLTEGEPHGKFVRLSMQEALQRSRLSIKDLSFIKTHGTGTIYNDRHEAIALKELGATDIPICAYKGHLGHTTDASGLLETLLAGFALHQRVLLPIKNLEEPEFDLNFVKSAISNFDGKFILCNNFGFGGYNSSLIIEKVVRGIH